MKKGKIITFYSYKGGVGRTMSLANIATILAQWDYKVLVVDWDLEAPGLERYFMNYSSIKLDKKRGVIDLLLRKSSNNKVNWNRYLLDIKIVNKHTLKFLGSGKKGSDYFDKLKKLDIDSLYEKNSGFEFFERLRDEWKSEFDYILIDSRTGITDNVGICTIQLPDIVFVFTNTNEQSVLGTKEIIERINFSQQSQPYDRQNLIIFPILSRFDTTTEFEISQVWIKKVSETLTNVYNDWLPLKVELKEFIEKTKIPYFPYFSFGEKLSVLEQGYSDPASMGYAYESLASIIVNNFENINSFINNRSSYINHAKKTYSESSFIKIIGVGGGGSNAVTHMYNLGIQGVDYCICNTDSQALDTSPVPVKVHLGKRELGPGNIPAVGREAALETVDEIKELLEHHTKMVFITAGMGGGTGTGAAPVVAQVAQELDILTVGIVTLPFGFEGRKRMQQALEGLEEMRKHVDTLLIISNDKLREEYGNMKLTEAFKRADDVLTTAAKGIAEIITVTGYINVDFEDVNTVMRRSGKAIMGSAKAEGENRALNAIEDAMRSPLLNDSNIAGAQNILLYITSGEDEVSLDEVLEITDYIQQTCGNTAEVIWGNGKDDTLGNNIAITIIATGFNEKIKDNISSKQKNEIESKSNDRNKRLKELSIPRSVEDIEHTPAYKRRSDNLVEIRKLKDNRKKEEIQPSKSTKNKKGN
jgi:cell division protein FtsZ